MKVFYKTGNLSGAKSAAKTLKKLQIINFD